jgi:hypothetical protein
MLRKIFPEVSHSYATYENAEKAFIKVCGKIGVTDMPYVIAATPDGRYFPIALPSEKLVQEGIALAHNGVAFART